MVVFLNGCVAMGCSAAALLFLRFWRDVGDRLFLYFSVAFAVFAIDYGALGVVPFADEHRWYIFAVRLIGFLAILWGIVQNNRTDRAPAGR